METQAGRLTPEDVQQAQFRRSFRGYDEQEVDDFLDRVTEELTLLLEEQRTARAQAGTVTAPISGADRLEQIAAADEALRRARDEADSILQRAREQAAAILDEARSAAGASVAPVTAGAAMGAFVTREKAFLQRMAALIQEHAESVRRTARDARRSPAASAARPPAASSGAGTAASDQPRGASGPEAGSSGGPVSGATQPAPPRLPDPPRPPVEPHAGGFGDMTYTTDAPTQPVSAAVTGPADQGGRAPGPGAEGSQGESSFGEQVIALAGEEPAELLLLPEDLPAGQGASPEGGGSIGPAPSPAVQPSASEDEATADRAGTRQGGRTPRRREVREASLRELFWGEE